MSAAGWERTVAVGTAAETQTLAAVLGSQLQAGDLLVLTGELGAGKTTFTQGLGEGLGVRAGIISPTFVLVRVHPNLPDGPRPGGPDLVHVDAYRLGSAAEIDDIDLENTMDSAVTVVEWGRGRVEHLSESRLEVDLVRSLGGGPGGPGRLGVGPAAPGVPPSGLHGPASLDFDAEDDDEPRVVMLRGFGPRWVVPPSLPPARPTAADPPALPAPAGTPNMPLPSPSEGN